MVICTAALIVWSVLLKAPLEQPATSAKAPNPSKAPWYFLGLQEMLVYYDPWMAGVVLPTMIIVGLIAGWATGKLMKGSGFGVLGDIVIGILGAILGGWIMRTLGIAGQGGLIYTILVAILGAVILVWVIRKIRG